MPGGGVFDHCFGFSITHTGFYLHMVRYSTVSAVHNGDIVTVLVDLGSERRSCCYFQRFNILVNTSFLWFLSLFTVS